MTVSTKPDESDFEMRRHTPEQQALFPTEDLVIPESLRAMKKSVAAIHAVPSSPEHSLNLTSRRVFDGLIVVAQIDFAQRDKHYAERVRTERISPLFEVRVSELAKICGAPGKNYQRIYESLNHLYEMSFDWNVVGEDEKVIWESRARLLSTVGVGKGVKRGYIRYSIEPDMLAVVLEPHLWAKLSLQVMRGLGTAASYALYQTCWRYINTAKKVTAALPTQTWIELLAGKTRYVREEENGKTVVEYGEFKRRILRDAIERVNEVPVLSHQIKLKEHRQGNRVARLQFEFVSKPNSYSLPLSWPTEIIDVLRTSIGFSEQEIDNISQTYSSEVVADAILRLKKAEEWKKASNQTLPPRKPYFFGILKNISSGAKEIDHKQLDEEVRREAAQNAAEERQKQVQEGFEEHCRARFKSWVTALGSERKQALLADFQESNAENTLMYNMVAKGLQDNTRSALSLLRAWIAEKRPEEMKQIFSNPEDQSLEAWMAWKLVGGGTGNEA
jgi:hypothetical protein